VEDTFDDVDDLYSAGGPRTGLLFEETVLPSPNSVDLLRTARSDYMLRFDSRTTHIAELFQENTKLTPYSSLQPPAGEEELNHAKKFYFSTSYRMQEDDVEPGMMDRVRLRHADLPAELARLMGPLGKDGPLASLLYGVDLFLLHRARLLRVIPYTDGMWVEKRMLAGEEELFRRSILRQPAEAIAQSSAFLCVVAVPWRHMMVLGPRGYRHMMLEAGNLLAQLQFIANQLKLSPRLSLDFYDARVDKVLLLDGTERTTLAVIGLQGGSL
jgi:hypothetical protein